MSGEILIGKGIDHNIPSKLNMMAGTQTQCIFLFILF